MHDLPELPTEIILVIIDKSRELLHSEIKSYISHRKDQERKKFPNREGREHYPLFHERLGLDDCVFWHRCWAYTALRLVNRFIGRHASKWANVEYVDAQIKHFEDEYDQEHPDHPALRRYLTKRISIADIAARRIPIPEHREKVMWMRREDVVPLWEKFMEAYLVLPRGTQLLPWQSGYDKAASYCCNHFDEPKLALLLKGPRLQALSRPNRGRLIYCYHRLYPTWPPDLTTEPYRNHWSRRPPAAQTAPAQTLPQASQQQEQQEQPGLRQPFHQAAHLRRPVQHLDWFLRGT